MKKLLPTKDPGYVSFYFFIVVDLFTVVSTALTSSLVHQSSCPLHVSVVMVTVTFNNTWI